MSSFHEELFGLMIKEDAACSDETLLLQNESYYLVPERQLRLIMGCFVFVRDVAVVRREIQVSGFRRSVC